MYISHLNNNIIYNYCPRHNDFNYQYHFQQEYNLHQNLHFYSCYLNNWPYNHHHCHSHPNHSPDLVQMSLVSPQNPRPNPPPEACFCISFLLLP